MAVFETVSDISAGADVLRVRRYGVIAAERGRLVAIHLRPFPKLVSAADLAVLGRWQRRLTREDSCWLYYNQPRWHSNFLALKYILSGHKATIATIRAALCALDAVAQIKRADALLCDVTNSRITDRMLAREGWEAHAPSRWHRNYIKRLYGSTQRVH